MKLLFGSGATSLGSNGLRKFRTGPLPLDTEVLTTLAIDRASVEFRPLSQSASCASP
jgi:hypothetical protein